VGVAYLAIRKYHKAIQSDEKADFEKRMGAFAM
jgi:hypothetical protein